MRHLLLIFALFLGCASAPDTPVTYQQGAYRPAPPRFVPSQDAPHTVGQPGHVRQPGVYVEPGPRPSPVPHTPQTVREDTIWASRPGDKPASMEVFWGFPFQIPGDANESPARRHIRECQSEFDAASVASGRTREALEKALTAQQRECLLASLLSKCLWRRDQIYEDAVRGNRLTRHLFPGASRALLFINAWKARACGERLEFVTPIPQESNAILSHWGRK